MHPWDPDLPSLAAKAAIEAELALAGESPRWESSRKLLALVPTTSEMEPPANGHGSSTNFDPLAQRLLQKAGESIGASDSERQSASQLVATAAGIADEVLKGGQRDHGQSSDALKWWLHFCLGICNAALAQQPPMVSRYQAF